MSDPDLDKVLRLQGMRECNDIHQRLGYTDWLSFTTPRVNRLQNPQEPEDHERTQRDIGWMIAAFAIVERGQYGAAQEG